MDEMSANCKVSRNTRRWLQKIFFDLLNTVDINTQIIYQTNMEEGGGAKKSISERNFNESCEAQY